MTDELIPPDAKCIEKYRNIWENSEDNEKYRVQEKVLNKFFQCCYPRNKDIEEVATKVSLLNDFYSTNIFDTFTVAKHLCGYDGLDEAIKNGKLSEVENVARVNFPNNVTKKFYSFTTKYFTHHNPNDFPIYDRVVRRLLHDYGKKFPELKVTYIKLDNYESFVETIMKFKAYFQLEAFIFRDIDR